MKKPLFALTLVVLCGALLSAQPPDGAHRTDGSGRPDAGDRPGQGRHPGQRGSHESGGFFRLAHALDLSEEQRAAWQEALQSQRESLQPIFDEMEILERQLHDLLALDEPDPTDVGLLTIDLHDLRYSLGESRELLEESLKDLLTPEQLAQWDEIKEEDSQRGQRRRGHHGGRPRPA